MPERESLEQPDLAKNRIVSAPGSPSTPEPPPLPSSPPSPGRPRVPRKGLSTALGVPEETVEPLLRAMVVAGQVVVLKVGGRVVYRAAG